MSGPDVDLLGGNKLVGHEHKKLEAVRNIVQFKL